MKEQSEEITLSKLAQKYSDNDKARALLESWIWPNGPVCPHCQSDRVFRLVAKPDSKSPVREGVLKCKACRKQFTVTVGTIFEKSHVPISKWMMAVFVLCSAKKGISAHQLHRMIGVTYKTAWFMFHRLRHAVKQGPLAEAIDLLGA
jgi:transposase-like protein